MKKLINYHFYAFFLMTTILLCCNKRIRNVGDKKIENTEILGEWLLIKKQINYPMLTFNKDSNAIFSSMGDTVYRFKYYVKDSQLVLRDINGVMSKNVILKLDRDSLIFKSLIKNMKIQSYKHKR